MERGTNIYNYAYDKNGNTTTDGLRGFSVAYNILNLPSTVTKGTEYISYIYNANGEKLAKRMKDGNYIYYAGNFVYNNDKTNNYIIFDEGRVTKLTGGYQYEYSIKDHLGNTRAVFKPNGTGVTALQLTDYYPYGTPFSDPNVPNNDNKYLYNGKEVQDDIIGGTAFGWLDYGARMYDPTIARWHTLDPLAEKYRRWSPYSYCVDNPIRFIDPDGMGIDEIISSIASFFGGGSSEGSGGSSSTGAGASGSNPSDSKGNATMRTAQASNPGNKTSPTTQTGGNKNQSNGNNKTTYPSPFKDFSSSGYTSTSNSSSSQLHPMSGFGGKSTNTELGYVALAMLLRNIPTLGFSLYPNPFFQAEAIGVDIGLTLAGSEADAGYIFMLAGPNTGQIRSMTEIAQGGGTDIGIGGELVRIDYTGNINNFTFSSLRGNRTKIYAGIGEVISVGCGVSYSNSMTGGKVIGTSVQLNFGFSITPISGGFNNGDVGIRKKNE